MEKKRLVEKKYLFTFILITSLFALWGFANDLTNPMVAAFQTVMELSAAKASMVQFAFYGGYATMAIPAALFIRRYSYKYGVLLGLALYAIGAFLFIPAAQFQQFSFFCISLYEHTIIYLSNLLFLSIWVDFQFRAKMNKVLRIFCVRFCGHMFSFSWVNIYEWSCCVIELIYLYKKMSVFQSVLFHTATNNV